MTDYLYFRADELVLKTIKLSVLVVQAKHGMKYKSMHDFEIRNSKFDGVLKFGSNYVHHRYRLYSCVFKPVQALVF